MHLIQIGRRLINCDHLIDVKLDAIVDPTDLTRAHVVNCLGQRTFHVLSDSPEGRALRWWLTEADRGHYSPFATFDLVAEHARVATVHADQSDDFPVDELVGEFRVMTASEEGLLRPAS